MSNDSHPGVSHNTDAAVSAQQSALSYRQRWSAHEIPELTRILKDASREYLMALLHSGASMHQIRRAIALDDFWFKADFSHRARALLDEIGADASARQRKELGRLLAASNVADILVAGREQEMLPPREFLPTILPAALAEILAVD